MKPRLIISFLLIAVMFAFTTSASAQSSYSFSLDKEIVQVYWNADGTEALDYQLTFTNDPSAQSRSITSTWACRTATSI